MSKKVTTRALFPLGGVLLPGGTLPLHVFEERYRRLVADVLSDEGLFGVVLITRGSEVGGGDQRSDIGTLARIERAHPLPDGRFVVEAVGLTRIRVESWLPDDPYPHGVVVPLNDEAGEESVTVAEIVRVVRWTCALSSEAGHGALMDPALENESDLDALTWGLCDAAPLGPLDRHRLLAAPSRTARLRLLHELCDDATDNLRRLLSGA